MTSVLAECSCGQAQRLDSNCVQQHASRLFGQCSLINPVFSTKAILVYRWFLFVLRFYGPVNPMGPCRARSVYLTTRLLDWLSPLSG